MDNKKILAVWGSPFSGKTLVSTKLANMLSKKKMEVVLVFCDPFVPSVPVILPNLDTEGRSLGRVLSSVEITQEKIYENCLSLKKNNYLAFLGYQKGESAFSYPTFTKSGAMDLIIQLRHIADIVIIDCSSHFSADVFTTTVLETADNVLRLGTCDLKGISYFSSQLPHLSQRRFNTDKHIKIISNFKLNQPKNEMKEYYGDVSFELPFVQELEEQYQTNGILERLKTKEGKKYEEILMSIAEEVFNG